MNINRTERNVKLIAEAIKQVLKRRSSITYMQELLGYKSNPYKGECYVASKLLYDLFEGIGMQLYKKKDEAGIWHWWIRLDTGDTIDITAEQYVIEELTVPSASYQGAVKAEPMTYESYNTRIKKLKEELFEYLRNQELNLDLNYPGNF